MNISSALEMVQLIKFIEYICDFGLFGQPERNAPLRIERCTRPRVKRRRRDRSVPEALVAKLGEGSFGLVGRNLANVDVAETNLGTVCLQLDWTSGKNR